jgi:PKD repeat protein
MPKIFPLFSALLLLTASAFGFTGTTGGLTRGSAIAADSSDARLSAAAAKVGWSLAKAKAVAARDRDLHLSADNRFFYVCRFHHPSSGGSRIQTGPDTSTFTGSRPSVDAVTAFQLHSRPGASKTLYLDFNGHTSPAGYWDTNAVTIPAFKLAGTASPTDQVNLNAIRDIWLHVAEAFAAWDVDVTTDATGIATKAGQRCVIGGRQDAVASSLWGYGTMGWSPVGSFGNPAYGNNRLNGLDFNNLVFIDCTNPATNENNIGSNPTASNYEVTMLCVAHEVGHSVGLNHWGEVATGGGSGQGYTAGHAVADHAGVTSVSPIMGNSALPGWPSVCNLNQWSKGDYPFSMADNPATTQDDIAVISTFATKLVGANDDHGNTLATATSVTGTSITAGGVIADSTDVDLFKITPGAGVLTLTATPHLKYRNYNGNLKIGLSLYNSSGVAVAGSYSLTGMGSTLTYSIPTAGTYYIKVNGLGYDPTKGASQILTNNGITGTVVGTAAGFTNYGSIGRYGLTGTWQYLLQAPTASITSDRTGGVFPVAVAFDGGTSTDPDGLVVGYSWNFGDPASAGANTSTLRNPVHTYAAPGTYTASLVVRDNQNNASAAATKVITVSGAALPNSVRVASMTGSWVRMTNVEVAGTAVIQVVNQYGQPLRSVAVYVDVTGSVSGKSAAKTDANGYVTIQMRKQRMTNPSTYTFTVTRLVYPAYTYNMLANLPSPASVTISR